jgi:hypothetical protein
MSSLNMLEFLRKEQLNQLLGSQERIQLAENCLSTASPSMRKIKDFTMAPNWQPTPSAASWAVRAVSDSAITRAADPPARSAAWTRRTEALSIGLDLPPV